MINSSFIYMTRYLSNVEKALLSLMLGFQQHPLAPLITVICTPLVRPQANSFPQNFSTLQSLSSQTSKNLILLRKLREGHFVEYPDTTLIIFRLFLAPPFIYLDPPLDKNLKVS